MATNNKSYGLSSIWQKITAPFANKTTLQTEVAHQTAYVGSARPGYWAFSAANLTPAYMVQMMDSARNGFPEQFWALLEYIEEADPEIRSLLDTRKRVLTGKEIIVEALGEDTLSQEVADVCRQALAKDFVPDMLFHMLDALWKGFSVLEMIVDTTGDYWMPSEVIYRPTHFFRIARDDGHTLLLKDSVDPLTGTPLEIGKYIVHKPALKSGLLVRNGLGLVGAWLYYLGTTNMKEWVSGTERNGKPFRIGWYAPGTPKQEVQGFMKALSMLGSDASAVLPSTMKVQLEKAASESNAKFYELLARFLSEQKAKLILGQTKSSDGQGGSLALAKAHLAVMEDIMIADIQSVIATLRRDYLGSIVRWNFGPDVPVPNVRFDIEDPIEQVSFMTAVEKAVGMGVEIDAADIRDRLGLPEPKPGAKLMTPAVGAAAADQGTGIGLGSDH